MPSREWESSRPRDPVGGMGVHPQSLICDTLDSRRLPRHYPCDTVDVFAARVWVVWLHSDFL